MPSPAGDNPCSHCFLGLFHRTPTSPEKPLTISEGAKIRLTDVNAWPTASPYTSGFAQRSWIWTFQFTSLTRADLRTSSGRPSRPPGRPSGRKRVVLLPVPKQPAVTPRPHVYPCQPCSLGFLIGGKGIKVIKCKMRSHDSGVATPRVWPQPLSPHHVPSPQPLLSTPVSTKRGGAPVVWLWTVLSAPVLSNTPSAFSNRTSWP